jgi:hypothetical protein
MSDRTIPLLVLVVECKAGGYDIQQVSHMKNSLAQSSGDCKARTMTGVEVLCVSQTSGAMIGQRNVR